ncbi:ankyrin repeat domain-containing protein [Alteromonas sp. a30]|uniref:ankyrin repeat domain-containing protein n=1 Tax=Alteromonas sp. a30 TaxID=2730917 RepID=UPI002282E7AE|nr:ankyrin repeat domain-containing protein [Alteromonas sp. a30]MCY7296453.1 ankyrin repeat domain-containing protein [Alteromonas sp. a30]
MNKIIYSLLVLVFVILVLGLTREEKKVKASVGNVTSTFVSGEELDNDLVNIDKKEMQCESFILDNINNNSTKYKIEVLREFVASEKSFIESSRITNIFFHLSGFGVPAGRLMMDEDKFINNSFPTFENEKFASFENNQTITELIQEDKFEEIIKLIYQKEIDPNNIFTFKGKKVTLVELIYRSFPKDRIRKITRLIDAGALVRNSDIVFFIKNGASLQFMEAIYYGNNISPDFTFIATGYSNSFATYALLNQRADLFYFWDNLGSPSEPNIVEPNALDILANRNNNLAQVDIDRIYEVILKKNIRANVESTPEKLSKIVSPVLFENFPVHQRNLLHDSEEKERNVLTNLTDKSYKLILKEIVLPELFLDENVSCLRKLGRDFFKSLSRSYIYNLNKSRMLANEYSEKHLNEIIQEAQEIFYSDEDVINYLGMGQGFKSKHLVSHFKQKRATEYAMEIANKSKSKGNSGIQDNLKAVYELAKKGMWDEATRILSKLEIENKNVMSTLLMIAISVNAQPEIVDSFLKKGAEFNSSIIASVIFNNNVDVAELLYSYGLDINYIDPLGKTPVMLSSQMGSLSILRWLIAKGSVVNSYSKGFDALDLALISGRIDNTKLEIIKTLINSGIIIEPSHKEIVERLKISRKEEYLLIIERFPELIL